MPSFLAFRAPVLGFMFRCNGLPHRSVSDKRRVVWIRRQPRCDGGRLAKEILLAWLHRSALCARQDRSHAMRCLRLAAALTIVATVLRPNSASATIVIPPTTVASLIHASGVQGPPGLQVTEVVDYLVLQPSGPSFSANLDSDTAISYSMSAPTDEKFCEGATACYVVIRS